MTSAGFAAVTKSWPPRAHTDRSDGVDTLATIAEATRTRGYKYFGVADHSKSAHYAGGLGAEEVAEQQAEVDALNKKYGRSFHIFKGIESDILADGSLDFPGEVMDTFDFVVASVHVRLKLDHAHKRSALSARSPNPTPRSLAIGEIDLPHWGVEIIWSVPIKPPLG